MFFNPKLLSIAVSAVVLGASFQTFAAGPDDANDTGVQNTAAAPAVNPAANANAIVQAMRQATQPKAPVLRMVRKSMGMGIRISVPVMNQPTRPPAPQGTEEDRKLG